MNKVMKKFSSILYAPWHRSGVEKEYQASHRLETRRGLSGANYGCGNPSGGYLARDGTGPRQQAGSCVEFEILKRARNTPEASPRYPDNSIPISLLAELPNPH